MSFFDQPYYALMKAHMSRIGIWPEQSKYIRIILPLTMFSISLTLAGPGFIRLYDTWRNIDILARTIAILLVGIATFSVLFIYIQQIDNIRVLTKNMEEHWNRFKNTPAVIVLHKYAGKGRYIIAFYSIYFYIVTTLYYILCLSPIVLDIVHPLNESRPKIYIVEAEYGVDADKYYWFIIGHTYIVTTTVLSIVIGMVSIYIAAVIHSFALFEIVGFNLELIANKYTVNKENAMTLRSDRHYKQICDCIILHVEAINFAGRIDDISSGAMGVVLGIIAIMMVISAIQALVSWKRPEVLIQQVTLIIGQVLHLYLISIPGQELMNRSTNIRTIAYNLDWLDMSEKAQKLLILILMRGNKPCYFTAGKFYIMSMETFGSAIQTVMSYFMIFAQMI